MRYIKYFNNIALNILIFISLVSLWGGIVYGVYSLNNIGIIISLILAIISFIIIQRFTVNNNKHREWNIKQDAFNSNGAMKRWNNRTINLLFVACYLLLAVFCFYILFSYQTTDSIISPWQVIPNYFFVIYALATGVLIIIINSTFDIRHSTFLISLHYFLSFSVALIVYKIGYGFDPFIHQATVNLIDKTGSVDPKPFYYLGQYALIIIFHKITFIPLIHLDKFLVPLLAAIYLPITFTRVLRKWFSDNITSQLLILLLLILPFSFFIVTAPQNFAYLLLILVILLGLICNNIFDLIIIYLFSLTAVIIHPIAGIPALMFALSLTVYHSDKTKLKKYLYSIIVIVSTFSLTASFYWVEKSFSTVNNNSFKFSLNNLVNVPKLIIPGQENFILNFLYLYIFNINNIIGLTIVAGMLIAYKHKERCKIFFIYFLMALSMLASYLLTKKLPFLFLIDYERNNYTDRILLMAGFFLLPFIIIALYTLIKKILLQSRGVKIPIILFIIILITTSLYASYPRFDRYYNSKGFSTGQNDIDAVHWIEKDASNDYIVLANQQVSAAALQEFGFSHYYKNDIFYYPIPTGGSMYQYYLDMVNKKPSRETVLSAMDLAGVSEGYFVLNKYWWAFPKILEEAKLEADNWEEINNGEIFIFKYMVD